MTRLAGKLEPLLTTARFCDGGSAPGKPLSTDTASALSDSATRVAIADAVVTRVSMMKYLFLVVGAALMAGAGVSAKNARTFIAESVAAPGSVIDLVRRQSSDSDTYAPVVKFVTQTGEAIEFTSSTSSSPPSYRTGERVEVLYRPLMPHDARINAFGSLWASSLMLGALGAVFFAIGAGIILFAVYQARKAADLMKNGKRCLTTVQRVELNEHLRVNGKNPYQVLTQWQNPATGQTRIFRSNNVWFDPSEYLNGRNVTVFVGRGNPDRYHVDLSFLPESAK